VSAFTATLVLFRPFLRRYAIAPCIRKYDDEGGRERVTTDEERVAVRLDGDEVMQIRRLGSGQDFAM